MEPMIQEEFVAWDGMNCPFCRSEDFVVISTYYPNDATMHEKTLCLDCNKKWITEFRVTGYRLLESEVTDA